MLWSTRMVKIYRPFFPRKLFYITYSSLLKYVFARIDMFHSFFYIYVIVTIFKFFFKQ